MTMFIICFGLFVVSAILCFIGIFSDCNDELFTSLLTLLVTFGILTLISGVFVKQDVKAIEYPASEYDFKIKVVEFEQQKDTILVIIPKKHI